jgi:hypothetical protein
VVDVAAGVVADAEVVEGEEEQAAASPTTPHTSPAAAITRPFLDDSGRRTLGRRACRAASAPPEVPATDGTDGTDGPDGTDAVLVPWGLVGS